jgi:hypothetical protein
MRKSIYAICCLIVLGLIACSEDKPEKKPPIGPVVGNTLHHIPCEQVVSKVQAYGEWVGSYLGCDSVGIESAPRYWDISVDELRRVLSYCSAPNGGDTTVRIYLGRGAFGNQEQTGAQLADLILVPLITDTANDTIEGLTPDLSHAHDLISPCPSTCRKRKKSGLASAFFEGVNQSCSNISIEDPQQNPCLP